MLAIKINDVKRFMNRLLIGDTLDAFPVSEAEITTFNTFSIDGQINKDFFDTDVQETLAQEHRDYSLWKDLKAYCYSIIRGKRTPLQFKIVFQTAPEHVNAALGISGQTEKELPGNTPAVRAFFLNIQYRNRALLCTTGVSLSTFLLDKGPEQQWDASVLDFFKRQKVDFELL